MLKFHPIPAFMKTYTNFKKIFLVRDFWLIYIFRIKCKIPILDLMSLPKNSVPFEGLYSISNFNSPACHPSPSRTNLGWIHCDFGCAESGS